MIKRVSFLLFVPIMFSNTLNAQTDTNYVLNFNFNTHQIKEADNKLIIKPVGVSLTDDRFGNKQSAIYLHGHPASYLNLGTSSLLKPKSGTISLWVNLDHRVYAGKGNDVNPIIITKNGPGNDFHCSYALYYDCLTTRLGAASHKDSSQTVNIMSTDEAVFNKWYHLVATYDNNQMAFYVNGQLQQHAFKGYETMFLKTDSVVIGNGASKKNDRWSQGIVDDIQIFHRVLNASEVKELYETPNPNRGKIILNNILFKPCGADFVSGFFISGKSKKKFEKRRRKIKIEPQII